MDESILLVRIWKVSHGRHTFSPAEREEYKKKRIITVHSQTGRGQGEAFNDEMRPGDFFYLCHGNDIQLLGRVQSPPLRAGKWLEREYRKLQGRTTHSGHFSGHKKGWTPNYRSTCYLVPDDELRAFEKQILKPFFGMRLRDLPKSRARKPQEGGKERLKEPLEVYDSEALAGLHGRKYREGRERLVSHRLVERNPALVRDAKRAFKSRHGRLPCEACEFDFAAKYGNRGEDFIEAHHRTPIAKSRPRKASGIKDLRMVCANCHRMLHRRPWITVEVLRSLLRQ